MEYFKWVDSKKINIILIRRKGQWQPKVSAIALRVLIEVKGDKFIKHRRPRRPISQ